MMTSTTSEMSSLNTIQEIPHRSLLALITKAHSLMPSLPPPHLIPHMPLLAAYTLKDRLLPSLAHAAPGVSSLERMAMQKVHLATVYVLAVVIAACGVRPMDFRLELASKPSHDVVPTLFDPVCRAAGVPWPSIRRLIAQHLGPTCGLTVRVRCDDGVEELMVPPSAFVQVTETDRFGRQSRSERCFSAQKEEEDWALEQMCRQISGKEEYVDIREVVPDDVLYKFEMPIDTSDLVLSHNTYTYDQPIWPSEAPSAPNAPVPIGATYILKRPQAPRTNSSDSSSISDTASLLLPPMSRGSSALTDHTLATPSILCLSPLGSRASSPCVPMKSARTPSPYPMASTPVPAEPVRVSVPANSAVRLVRSTTVPVQRYEGGNVLVRGSGLLLGVPGKLEECEDLMWVCEEECEYVEEAQPVVEVAVEESVGHSRRPSALELDFHVNARTPTPAVEEGLATARPSAWQLQQEMERDDEEEMNGFPAFKLHLSYDDEDLFPAPCAAPALTKPVSALIRLPPAPPCHTRPLPLLPSHSHSALPQQEDSISPSSSASFSASGSCSSGLGMQGRKKRGKRGGKQVQARRERAIEVARTRAAVHAQAQVWVGCAA